MIYWFVLVVILEMFAFAVRMLKNGDSTIQWGVSAMIGVIIFYPMIWAVSQLWPHP